MTKEERNALDESKMQIKALIQQLEDRVKDVCIERDRYKARCEALEKAFRKSQHSPIHNMCYSCVHYLLDFRCECNELCDKDFSAWQFDEARFSGEQEAKT